MTRSWNSGRQPEKPKRPVPGAVSKPGRTRGRDFQEPNPSDERPSIRDPGNGAPYDLEGQVNLNLPQWGPARNALAGNDEYSDQYERPEPTTVDVGRRAVALLVDFLVCYLFGILTTLIPFVNHFLTLYMAMGACFLCRDFFFQGRGIGKNIMGFQVVDGQTGVPASLVQSFTRNIILIAPLIAVQVISAVLRVIPIAAVTAALMQLVNIVAGVYVIVVLPMECYRALTRADSLRKGDELAGTVIVEAPMDFSNFLPTQKS